MRRHNMPAVFRDRLLDGIQGGEFHQREKASDSNPLPISHFTEIGQILRACAKRPALTEELLDRLSPHRSSIIGALPSGLQAHGLISDINKELDDVELRKGLYQITEERLKQWIIDDGSLVYGELKREELDAFFSEVSQLLNHTNEFIDLGSGLGKVVMTAAVSVAFESYLGVELLPYRHRLAIKRFDDFCQSINECVAQPAAGAIDPYSQDTSSQFDLGHLAQIPSKVDFQPGDMFACDVSRASFIFIYSTCFGSLMHKIANKLASESPEGCLVSTTTYAINHPGFVLVKHFPANSMVWTDLRFYERVGKGPWAEQVATSSAESDRQKWRESARELLRQPVGG
ncbi:MAG TPA: histone methylation protein DOT1-like protein [Gammaproteobacteria bacterium]|nr:histone methylation protein DOT1-like protein [Gammaproteobacteria bacterium]